MTTQAFPWLRRLVAALALVCLAAAAQAATITIINNDGPGEGFNDATPAAPVGGNTGTTIGEQRLIVFQQAAAIWGGILPSGVEIRINSTFDPLSCTATSAVLGSCGATEVFRDFAGVEFPGTWYSKALANKIFGADLDPTTPDMTARFNSNLGNTGCLTGSFWYYGLDHNHGTNVDLLVVLLHEMAHGLGFQTFTNGTTGAQLAGYPDVFSRFMYDQTTGLHWDEETADQRTASAIVPFKLLWDGGASRVMAPMMLDYGRAVLRVNAPPAIAGDLAIGTAAFGPALFSPGITGDVVLADDGVAPTSDACTPLVNGALVAGKIALVDRGTCTFAVKVKACQDAGAIGVIVADNAAGAPPAGMGGADPTITIPSVRVTQADGIALKAQIASGLNVTLRVDPTLLAGADPQGRVMLYTPNPFQSGSSLSHFDVTCTPNLLMEPAINNDLTSSVDLTHYVFEDIGWLDRVTPALAALVNASAVSGQVQLQWELGVSTSASLYRTTDGQAWARIARLTPDGSNRVRYEDGSVTPGQRYGYRLGLVVDGREVTAGEAWVDVPLQAEFALKGARPNPSNGPLTLSFSLANSSPARIELVDLSGRRVFEQQVGDLGAGFHVVRLDANLPAGIYAVRLTQGSRTLTTKATIVR